MYEGSEESTGQEHEAYQLTIAPTAGETKRWTIFRVLRCCIPKQLKLLNHIVDAEERYRQRKRTESTRVRNRIEQHSLTDRYQLVSPPPNRRNLSRASFTTADSTSPSWFLGRLPLELRRFIYEYVLGGRKVLYLVMTPHGIIRCIFRSLSAHGVELCLGDGVHPQLLRTCRQIYNEALGIMYTSNLVSVREGYVPACATDLYVLPQRINVIKHLRVQWFFDFSWRRSLREDEYYNGHSWRLFWNLVVTEMTCLETLEMRFVFSAPYEWSDEIAFGVDAPWAKPLHKVKGLKEVKLKVQWTGRSRPAPKSQVAKLVDGLKEIMIGKSD